MSLRGINFGDENARQRVENIITEERLVAYKEGTVVGFAAGTAIGILILFAFIAFLGPF